MIPVYMKDRERTPRGLVNGQKILLSCSNCCHPLVEIWITQPDARRPDGSAFRWKARATCWKCAERGVEDGSYPVEFEGNFFPAPAARPAPVDAEGETRPQDDILVSALADVQYSDQDITFFTIKPPA